MVSTAGGVSPAPPSSFASLERTLERTVDTLMKGESSAEAKALLIEARRLRSIVANWRSLPPSADVYDEMLERVLNLSTSAGASLYDPGPSAAGAELEPLPSVNRGPLLYDDLEQTERTELDPSSRLSRDAAFPPAEARADNDGPTIQEHPYYPPVHAATTPSARREAAGNTGKRAPERRPPIAAEDDESTMSSASAEARGPDLAPPRHPRPLMPSSSGTTGTRPAEPLRTNSGMAARGRALGTRSGMPAFQSSHSLEEPPEYPAFDSPAYGDDAPSYPSFDLNAAARQQLATNAGARYDAASAAAARVLSISPQPAQSTPPPSPAPARVPSPMPARLQSSPALMRSGYPEAIPEDRPRSRFPSDTMGMENETAPEEAPVAPATSVTVHPVQISEKVDSNIVLLSDAHSDRADAYRALRRKLASSGNPQVIAVTSADAGEGKTTCALNLALAMRETSHGKVLLIEANGYSPAIARLLGFETPECFYDQLFSRREDPRKPWVAVEVMPKLHIMAVDPTIKRAPQLEPLAFGHGMARLKLAGYEYILLDTPSVLGTFEVNLIADNVAGVLFTAITMKSKRSHLRKAIEQITPAPVLGVLVLDS